MLQNSCKHVLGLVDGCGHASRCCKLFALQLSTLSQHNMQQHTVLGVGSWRYCVCVCGQVVPIGQEQVPSATGYAHAHVQPL